MSEPKLDPSTTIGTPGRVARTPSDLPPGTSIGRYVLLQGLGKGGMGAVYAAYDAELDRRVALKFLRTGAEGPLADEWRARLLREAKAMARLSHPNVVTLYDVGLSGDGRIFLAMEVAEGGTLKDWLQAERRSWRAIVSVFCEAGEGLAAAHRAGVVHRDFKPDNVLLGTDGRARVTDFGLARGTDGGAGERDAEKPKGLPEAALQVPDVVPPPSASSGSLPRLTLTGTMMGTPGYMAPEQYTGDEVVDARADVFAFCAALYRALYRQWAFEGETFEQISEATVLGRVREPPKGSDVPQWVRRVVSAGLATERERRPASMEEILAALRADPRQRRRRWLLAGGALAAAGAGVLALHAAGERRVSACRASEGRLDGVWDASRKASAAKAFEATSRTYAPDTWSHVEKRLDAYAAAWAQGSYAACEATRVKGEQSEAMLELRTACLDERLGDLRALVDIFASADAKTVENAVQATTALAPIEACSNVDRLTATTRLPPESRARDEIHALQASIATATDLRITGKHTQSREDLEAIRARVEAAGYGPVIVAWTMAVAEVDTMGDVKAAAGEGAQAIALADSYRLDRERAQSELCLVHVYNEIGEPENAHRWLGLASATIARLGGDPELALSHDVYEGVALYNEAKYADAVRVLEPAIARARVGKVDLPLAIAGAESYLGLALLYEPPRFADALAHARSAVAVDEEAFGPLHPEVGKVLSNLGIVEEETGHLDDALASASRALRIYQGAGGELSPRNVNLANVTLNTGEILARIGRSREAVPLLQRARDIYKAINARDGVVDADRSLADALRAIGRLADASRACDEARVLAESTSDLDPQLAVERLVVEAKVALERGDVGTALPVAERAVSLAPGVAYVYDLASARLVLARALSRGARDPARVRELAGLAREGFAKLGDEARVSEAAELLK